MQTIFIHEVKAKVHLYILHVQTVIQKAPMEISE